jgi:invasion protein IalB
VGTDCASQRQVLGDSGVDVGHRRVVVSKSAAGTGAGAAAWSSKGEQSMLQEQDWPSTLKQLAAWEMTCSEMRRCTTKCNTSQRVASLRMRG